MARGSALGAAVLGAVLFIRLGTELNKHLDNIPGITEALRTQVVDSVPGSAGQSIVAMDRNPTLAPVVADAKASYTDSARWTAWTAGIFVFFGLLVSFGLPRTPSRKKNLSSMPQSLSPS
ncbi:MAG: hypothetical protein ACOYD0_07165 [Candidatus Nanopelagicales bacterium]